MHLVQSDKKCTRASQFVRVIALVAETVRAKHRTVSGEANSKRFYNSVVMAKINFEHLRKNYKMCILKMSLLDYRIILFQSSFSIINNALMIHIFIVLFYMLHF